MFSCTVVLMFFLDLVFFIHPSDESELRKEIVLPLQPEAASFLLFAVDLYRLRFLQQIPRAMPVYPACARFWVHGNLASSSSRETARPFSDVTSGVCVFTEVAGSGQSKLWVCRFFRVPEHISEPLTPMSNCSVAVFFFSYTVLLCEGTWTPVWRLNPRRGLCCQEKYLPSSQGCVLMQEYFGVKRWGYYTFFPHSNAGCDLTSVWTGKERFHCWTRVQSIMTALYLSAQR